MPAKQIRRTVWLSESEFKNNEGFRNELYEAINCPAFIQAIHILTKRRQTTEATIEAAGIPAPEITSVRMQSQRVGMEGLLNDLDDLCSTPTAPIEEEPATFGADQE